MTSEALDCHYSITGSGPAIFLTHGVGATEDAWRFITPKLSENFTVITYDLRGHGKSPVTHKNFGLEELVLDLERVREKANIDKGHFIGHSLGGMIAPAYSKKYPDKVLSIGMLSTVAGRSEDDSKKVSGGYFKFKLTHKRNQGSPERIRTENSWRKILFLRHVYFSEKIAAYGTPKPCKNVTNSIIFRNFGLKIFKYDNLSGFRGLSHVLEQKIQVRLPTF